MNQTSKDFIKAVSDKVRVTKVIATRSVKGQRGDSFAGFSAGWNTVQDDGTQGLDETPDGGTSLQAMTIKESRVASYLLALQADVHAHQHAWAGGSISQTQCDDAVRTARANYLKLISDLLDKDVK